MKQSPRDFSLKLPTDGNVAARAVIASSNCAVIIMKPLIY